MSATLCSLLLLTGMAVTTYGVYCLHPAAGYVTLGLMLMATACLLYMSTKPGGR
jgi:hypothetical protein